MSIKKVGYNYRLSNLLAALGHSQLERLIEGLPFEKHIMKPTEMHSQFCLAILLCRYIQKVRPIIG